MTITHQLKTPPAAQHTSPWSRTASRARKLTPQGQFWTVVDDYHPSVEDPTRGPAHLPLVPDRQQGPQVDAAGAILDSS